MADQVIAILEHFIMYQELMKQNIRSDKLRLMHDKDAVYYLSKGLSPKESLRGDTIVSFWTPYKRLLTLEVGKNVNKNVDGLKSLIIETNSNEKIKELNKRIQEFAQLYYTAGNFMLLPEGKRRMNNQRYQVAEDRIDLTLYQCFNGGKLAKFFENDTALEKWIQDEHLDSVFINKVIDKENIDWFVEPKKISVMNADEVYAYLDRAIQFIQHRNQLPDEKNA